MNKINTRPGLRNRFYRVGGVVLSCLGMSLCGSWALPVEPQAGTVEPSTVLTELQAGNKRFRENRSRHPHEGRKRLMDTARFGQHPKAIVLGCADSRVTPELLFDQGIGDLFDVRVAGNVANEDEIASMEYAVEHLHTRVIVVLGHTGCGAVTAVASGGKLPSPSLEHLAVHIGEAVQHVRHDHPSFHGTTLIEASIEANVRESVRDISANSKILAHALQSHEVAVVGAVYDLKTGKVKWLSKSPPEPSQPGSAH